MRETIVSNVLSLRHTMLIVVIFAIGAFALAAPSARAAVTLTGTSGASGLNLSYSWSALDTPTTPQNAQLIFTAVSGDWAPAGSQWVYALSSSVATTSSGTLATINPAQPVTNPCAALCVTAYTSSTNGMRSLPDGTYDIKLQFASSAGTSSQTLSEVQLNGPTQPPILTAPVLPADLDATGLTLSYSLPEAPWPGSVFVQIIGSGTYGATDCSLSRWYLVMADDQSVTTRIPYATPGTDSAGKVARWTANMTTPVAPAVAQPYPLYPGCSYTISMDYRDAYPHARAGATSSALVLPVLPSAPTGVSVLTGVASLEVGWGIPAAPGGITSFTATASPGGASCSAAGTGTTCAILGLEPGQAYDVAIVATNRAGTGPAATVVGAVAGGTPESPTGVTAAASSHSVRVAWSAAATRGVPVLAYQVVSSPGGRSCTDGDPAVPVLHCDITGLANGVAYTFTVRARSMFGFGGWSASSSAVTPATTPGAPANVRAEPGHGSATVSWNMPDDGGSAITSTTVHVYANDASSVPGCSTSGAATSCTVTGLSPSTTYRFSVTATNAVGAGGESGASPAMAPLVVAAAPAAVTVRPGAARLAVSWNAVSAVVPIGSYRVTTTPASDGCVATAPATSCIVRGLVNGTAYAVAVVAVTTAGEIGDAGNASSTYRPGRPPDAPGGVAAVSGAGGTAVVSWNPAADNGAPVTGYVATATPGGRTCAAGGAAATCTITGLAPGVTYAFTVVATSDAGDGARSTAALPALAIAQAKAFAIRSGRVLRLRMLARAVHALRSGAPAAEILHATGRSCAIVDGTVRVGTRGMCVIRFKHVDAGRRSPAPVVVLLIGARP